MTEDNIHFIKPDESSLKNHISEDNNGVFPFEFSSTNLWNSDFLPHSDISVFNALNNELQDIKQILTEIKIFLTDTFK